MAFPIRCIILYVSCILVNCECNYYEELCNVTAATIEEYSGSGDYDDESGVINDTSVYYDDYPFDETTTELDEFTTTELDEFTTTELDESNVTTTSQIEKKNDTINTK